MTACSDLFFSHFGYRPETEFTAPGRVNLIGDHTDYNGGSVLPTVMDRWVSVAVAPVSRTSLQISSSVFPEPVERGFQKIRNNHWSDYIVASFRKLIDEGCWEGGADVVVSSTIPHGAGVSSSAALITAVLMAGRAQAEKILEPVTCAKWAQQVENDYLGVPCGIMDQMAVALAKPGEALLLDTDTLAYELIGLPTGVEFVVCHSGIERKLDDGRYADRRRECEDAARHLSAGYLCQLNTAQSALIDSLPEPLNRRARHALTEHGRVLRAAEALKKNDMALFGGLMTQSHQSLSSDFDVSLPQIDGMVMRAVEVGALGSRMTGGGFGGCFVSLVDAMSAENWKAEMSREFSGLQFI